MANTKMILAAHKVGWLDGAMGKKPKPSAVPGYAATVAAYMAGWAKGWADIAAAEKV